MENWIPSSYFQLDSSSKMQMENFKVLEKITEECFIFFSKEEILKLDTLRKTLLKMK